MSESVYKESCVDLRYDFRLDSEGCFEALWCSKTMDFYQSMYWGPISTVSRPSEALKAKCRECTALDPCVRHQISWPRSRLKQTNLNNSRLLKTIEDNTMSVWCASERRSSRLLGAGYLVLIHFGYFLCLVVVLKSPRAPAVEETPSEQCFIFFYHSKTYYFWNNITKTIHINRMSHLSEVLLFVNLLNLNECRNYDMALRTTKSVKDSLRYWNIFITILCFV